MVLAAVAVERGAACVQSGPSGWHTGQRAPAEGPGGWRRPRRRPGLCGVAVAVVVVVVVVVVERCVSSIRMLC